MEEDELTGVISRCRHVIGELLKITHPLVEVRPVGNTNFLRVLEACYRRAHHGLQAVSLLSTEPHLGSPALIIARSLAEDLISIEYMIATNKETKAKSFRDFYWIQALQDNAYIKEQGLGGDPQIDKSLREIEEQARKVEDQFWHDKKKHVLRKSWDGKSVDQMLDKLLSMRLKEFPEKELKTVAHDYLQACRKTHFNPIDLAFYLDGEALSVEQPHTMAQALLMAAGSFVRLTTRYRDEISRCANKNLYEDIATRANELLFSDPILNP